MKSIDLADAVLARLDAILPGSATVHDHLPLTTPAGLYCYVVDDPGTASAERVCDTANRLVWRVSVISVGPTPPGARLLSGMVRDALTGWRPDPDRAAGPLREVSVGPMLDDGPEGDKRYSQTITYAMSTNRS